MKRDYLSILNVRFFVSRKEEDEVNLFRTVTSMQYYTYDTPAPPNFSFFFLVLRLARRNLAQNLILQPVNLVNNTKNSKMSVFFLLVQTVK